jgi:hypothetical protein
MSWATHSHSPLQEGSPDIPLDGVMQDAAYLLRRICLLVHSQNRLSAKCYADRHETTYLRASAFGRGARGPGGRPALVRRLRPPSLPDPPCQLQGRERLCHSPLVGLRSPDGAHSHKALQRGGASKRRCASTLPDPRGSTPPSTRAVPRLCARCSIGAPGSSARTRACGRSLWPRR